MVIYEPALLMIGDLARDYRRLRYRFYRHPAVCRGTAWFLDHQDVALAACGAGGGGPAADRSRTHHDIIGAALAGVVILSQLAARRAAAIAPAAPKPVESTP